jgi:hypothetical protein
MKYWLDWFGVKDASEIANSERLQSLAASDEKIVGYWFNDLKLWLLLEGEDGKKHVAQIGTDHFCYVDCLLFEVRGPEKKEPETIKDWLETLPDGYRERALANLDNDSSLVTSGNLSGALFNAFEWDETKEGDAFWDSVWAWASYPETRQLPKLP